MKGKVLGNRYEIIEKIGEGGMANIYTARCRILNRIVAVKILKDEFTSDEDFAEKFRNEALAAASLNHDNIITVYDVGQEDDIPYIVMEYVDGIDIKEYIRKEGKLEEYRALRIIRQIAAALSEAHRKKIIHRDIKPHNIMITKDNRIKVGDFGIAKAVTESTITSQGGVLGSVHYFSPEQARGGYMDERSDIYSLGIVLYELLTGKLPFFGDTPVNIAIKHIHNRVELPPEDFEQISDNTKMILKRMTEKNIDKRYPSVDRLIQDIDETSKGHDIYSSMDYDQDFETKKILFRKEDIHKINSASEYEQDEAAGYDNNEQIGGKVQLNDYNKRQDRKMMAFAIVLALLASIAFLTAFFFFSGDSFLPKNLFGGEKLVLPSFLGMTLEEAQEQGRIQGFIVEKGGEILNSKYEPGTITEQEPREGSKVQSGQIVKVTLSKMVEAVEKDVTIPETTNRKVSTAEKMLRDAGLIPVTSFEYSSTVASDIVISQQPAAGSVVKENTEVVLKVSQGREEVFEKVPKLEGVSLEQAQARKGNFKLDIGEKEDPNVENGIVLSQNPKAGTDAKQGSTITVIVNRIEVPKEPELVKENLTLLLPESDQVHVQLKDLSTGAVIYDQVVNPREVGGIVSVDLVGKVGETRHIDIYFDSQHDSTQAISFE